MKSKNADRNVIFFPLPPKENVWEYELWSCGKAGRGGVRVEGRQGKFFRASNRDQSSHAMCLSYAYQSEGGGEVVFWNKRFFTVFVLLWIKAKAKDLWFNKTIWPLFKGWSHDRAPGIRVTMLFMLLFLHYISLLHYISNLLFKPL